MNSKQILSKVICALVEGDKDTASSLMSEYMDIKGSKLLKEMDYVDKFNTSVDLKGKDLRLAVDGVRVDVKISGKQEAAYRTEHVGNGYPSYDEIYLYGEVKLSSIDVIMLNGVEVVENITSFQGSTADSLLSNLRQSGEDMAAIIIEGAEEKGVPQEVYGQISNEFGVKLVQSLARAMKDMEGED